MAAAKSTRRKYFAQDDVKMMYWRRGGIAAALSSGKHTGPLPARWRHRGAFEGPVEKMPNSDWSSPAQNAFFGRKKHGLTRADAFRGRVLREGAYQ